MPNLEEHLEDFLELLYFAFDNSIEDKKVKVLEDFLNKNGLKLEKMEKEEFKNAIRRSIEPLYQLAENQGFQVWV